jgi:hypothetical protein
MFTILATILGILFLVFLAMTMWEAIMQGLMFLMLNPATLLTLILVSVILAIIF